MEEHNVAFSFDIAVLSCIVCEKKKKMKWFLWRLLVDIVLKLFKIFHLQERESSSLSWVLQQNIWSRKKQKTTFCSKTCWTAFAWSAGDNVTPEIKLKPRSVAPQMESPQSSRSPDLFLWSSNCWFLWKVGCRSTSKDQPAGRVGTRPGDVDHLPQLPGRLLQVFPEVFVCEFYPNQLGPSGTRLIMWVRRWRHYFDCSYGKPLIGQKEPV